MFDCFPSFSLVFSPSLGAVVSVTAELGGSASLPCSLSSTHPGDRPRLVLWFREEEPARPIYTVDLRGKYSQPGPVTSFLHPQTAASRRPVTGPMTPL